MAKVQTATAADVRSWAREQGVTDPTVAEGARGRISPAVWQAFNATNASQYVVKYKPAATVELPVPHENVKHVFSVRNTRLPKSTVVEARTLAGLGARGRLSADGLATLGAAFATFK